MIRSSLTAALLIVSLTFSARADSGPAAPPAPRVLQLGSRNVDLVVEMDEKAKVARLVIPAKLLGEEKRPLQGADAGTLGNIIAGLALTCAMVSGGFWLVRKGKGRALAALLVTASMLTAGVTLLWANGAPPLTPKPAPTKPITLPAGIEVSGKLVLEVVANGDKVKLIVGKDMVKSGEDAPKPKE